MPIPTQRAAWISRSLAGGFGLLAGLHLAMVLVGARGPLAIVAGTSSLLLLGLFFATRARPGHDGSPYDLGSVPAEFLPQLLESIPDPAFIKDEGHRWILVNQQVCDLLRLPRREILGRTDAELFSPSLAALFSESDDLALARGESVRTRWRLDPRDRDPEAVGEILEGCTHKKPLAGRDGRRFVIGIVRDLTEVVASEESLKRQRDQARRDATSTGDFLSTLGHEIRNPLQAMLGASEMLRQEVLPPGAAETAHVLHRAGENLLALVDDILELSRLEAGAVVVREIPMDLSRVVSETAALFSPLVLSRGGRIDASLPERPLVVLGDEIRLRQILSNLVNNAVRYAGHTRIRIELDASPAPEGKFSVRLAVVDQGPGFAPEEGAELFRKWHRGSVRQPGSGLGLAIVHQSVGLLGGSIEARGELGKGACFTVRLPLRAVAGRGDDAEPTSRPEAAPSSDLPRMDGLRVLVAEDNRTNQMVLRRQLEKLGCRPGMVDDGRQALDRLEREAFDVVLMDCQMPVMDGFEATRLWRAEESRRELARTPILAVTALTLKAEQDECLAAGMDEVLAKPLRQADLQAALDRWSPRRGPARPLSLGG